MRERRHLRVLHQQPEFRLLARRHLPEPEMPLPRSLLSPPDREALAHPSLLATGAALAVDSALHLARHGALRQEITCRHAGISAA